eukprot:scaffold86885_cov26-Tisochrysis_lutea.AAC.2
MSKRHRPHASGSSREEISAIPPWQAKGNTGGADSAQRTTRIPRGVGNEESRTSRRTGPFRWVRPLVAYA